MEVNEYKIVYERFEEWCPDRSIHFDPYSLKCFESGSHFQCNRSETLYEVSRREVEEKASVSDQGLGWGSMSEGLTREVVLTKE